MKFILTLLFLTFSFSEDSTWWGCSDENALNYDPYAIWDCGDGVVSMKIYIILG